MNQIYLGHICLDPNMPNSNMVQEFINLTVEFEIICPHCGPKKHKIKKNGFDRKLKGSPQKFHCHSCDKNFFPHTSWIFKSFTNLIVEQVVEQLFIENMRPKDIAKVYKVSESFVTKIRYFCFNLLQKKVEFIRTKAREVEKVENLPISFQSAIWWDETFFRINGINYFLILIINSNGEVLGYKFSKTRNEDDYLSILLPIIDKLPKIPVIVCDGAPTYEGVAKRLKRELFLIQHIHSKPWQNAKIHHFNFNEQLNEVEQLTIQIPYDSFTRDERVNGYVIKRKSIIKEPTLIKKKRGRKKGQKDTKKRIKYGTKKIGSKESVIETRGRINIEKEGIKMSFNPKKGLNSWDIKKANSSSKRKNIINPDIKEIEKALTVTHEVMNGGYIQSNPIESKNSLIKEIINGKGLKDIYQYDYLTGATLYARQDLEQCYWENYDFNVKFRSSFGFTHMLELFHPEFDKITILERRKI